MDPRNAAQRAQPGGPDGCEPEAIEFVRFCYRRRRVGWPELYDEMCAVAGRGLYRGYGADELNGLGIGFSLFEMQALASLVQRVVAEDHERRRLAIQSIRIVEEPALVTEPAAAVEAPAASASAPQPSGSPPESSQNEIVERHPALVAAAAVPAGA